eukprot:scaffold43173_cov33-Prasinocladus_malaysianus.AAC.1
MASDENSAEHFSAKLAAIFTLLLLIIASVFCLHQGHRCAGEEALWGQQPGHEGLLAARRHGKVCGSQEGAGGRDAAAAAATGRDQEPQRLHHLALRLAQRKHCRPGESIDLLAYDMMALSPAK